jgi:hypothetical protein
MIVGLSAYGFVHTALSLLALVAGLIVVMGLLAAKRFDALTALYLASAVAANATAFGFPASFGVPHYIGGVTLVVLLVAILARYAFRLAGPWRWIYAITAVLGVYSLVFFTVGEAFRRVPALNAMAPTLTELPFTLAQLAAAALFVALAIAAAMKFYPAAGSRAERGSKS